MTVLNRRQKRISLVAYTAIILYFLFVAFHRSFGTEFVNYSLRIKSIPLWFPRVNGSVRYWLFSIGNVIAFIPFGFLIPWNLPNKYQDYVHSVLLFIGFIFLMEVLQMVTGLGSFDLEDILVNTMGYTIGYIGMKVAHLHYQPERKLFSFTLVALLGTVLSIGLAEIINPIL